MDTSTEAEATNRELEEKRLQKMEELESIEEELREKRLQRVNELDEEINNLLNQISAFEQELSAKIRPLTREVKELQKVQEKTLRKIYPIIYRIKVKPFAKFGTGYFSSHQKAEDMIAQALCNQRVKWKYSIFSIASDEIKENITHLLDEMPENKLWVDYISP